MMGKNLLYPNRDNNLSRSTISDIGFASFLVLALIVPTSMKPIMINDIKKSGRCE